MQLMAFIELPIIADTPDQSFSVILDGSLYQVRLRYNGRAGCWALSLFNAAGAPLIAGMAVRLGVDLLAQFSDNAFPPGRLFIINWADEYAKPGRKNFGSDVSLIYEEAE
jgi:hypothetical protein